MIKKFKRSIVVFAMLVVSLLGVGNAFADFDGMDSVMTISPPKQNIVLTPGEDFEGSITVSSSSTSKKDLAYSVTVGAFSLVKDENGNTDYNDVDVDTVTSYNQIMDWIELKKEEGTVPRGGMDTIPFVIHVPNDAPAGGQYATIIVQNDTENDAQGGGVQIESKVRFASNIFAEVTGDTKNDGVILENNIPSFLLTNQLSVSSLVKNEGNVHTYAEYILQIWPLIGDEEIYTNEENPETSMIMPDTERYFTQTYDHLPSLGIFRVKQTVKVFGKTSIAERTIIVCPIWLLFLIIFGVIALVIWVVLKMRGGKRRSSSRDD